MKKKLMNMMMIAMTVMMMVMMTIMTNLNQILIRRERGKGFDNAKCFFMNGTAAWLVEYEYIDCDSLKKLFSIYELCE